MTLILRMKGKINNANAPKLTIHDPIEHRVGSLFLWDAGKGEQFALNRGANIPNLLNEYSAGDTFEFTTPAATPPASDYARVEKTQKGGLHYMVSQASTVDRASSQDAFFIQPTTQLAQKMQDAIITNAANLYISVWTKHTRHVTKTDGQAGVIAWVANNTTNAVGYMLQANSKFDPVVAGAGKVTNSGSKLALTSKQSLIVGQANYYQFVAHGYNGTAPTVNQRFKIGAGAMSPWSGGIVANQAINACPSYIVYRVYIEDLSLSGRTFEQVKAIDDAEHAKAFAAGGRFYGDTWSNPTTILP